MSIIIGILKGTPWYVFLIFALLIKKGIEALKTRVVSLKKLFILPFVLLIWSLYSLFTNRICGFSQIAIWILALATGSIISWNIFKSLTIKADKIKALIALEGSSSTLIMSLLIFITKYFFGFYYATHQNNYSAIVVFLDLFSSGIINGMFIAKACAILNKYIKTQHLDLEETK